MPCTRRFLCLAQQLSPGDEQVCQRTGDEQPMRVLGQPAVTDLGKAKHALDDADGMFHFRAHFGLGAIGGAFSLAQRAMTMRLLMSEVVRLGCSKRYFI